MNAQPREISPPPDAPGRYSDRPFPGYRYVPGLHPHPLHDPAGHSHRDDGAHPPAEPLRLPHDYRRSGDYLFGVDLYNYGYWWEAHEAWEGLWRQAVRDELQFHFLQGLIQISASHLKRHVNQPGGVERLLARARGHLDPVRRHLAAGQTYMGVDLRAFMPQVDRYFTGRDERFPAIVLR